MFLAAGTAPQAVDEPIILDLDFARRQQEECAVGGRAGSRRFDESAEPDPTCVINAAGERPLSGQDIAAVGRHCGARRSKARAGERVGAVAPQFALRLDREMPKRYAVGERAIDRPPRGGAGGRISSMQFRARPRGRDSKPPNSFGPGSAQ